jgi:hypothetical protein
MDRGVRAIAVDGRIANRTFVDLLGDPEGMAVVGARFAEIEARERAAPGARRAMPSTARPTASRRTRRTIDRWSVTQPSAPSARMRRSS